MSSLVTVSVIGFLLAVVAFAVWTVWVSLREEVHTPKALRSEDGAGDG